MVNKMKIKIEKINYAIIKLLLYMFMLILVFVVIDKSRISSIIFNCSYIMVFILGLINFKKRKINILTAFIIILTIINVFLNLILNNYIINFNILKKMIIFVCTIIYFNTLIKVKIDKNKMKKHIKIINNILIVFLIFMYIFNYNKMFILNNITSDYLCFNFDNPNITAIFLLTLTIFEISFLVDEKKKKIKCVFLVAILFLVYFIIKTQSRNCLIILLLYVILLLYKTKINGNKFSNKIVLLISVWPYIFSKLYLKLIYNDTVQKKLSFLVSKGKGLDSRYYIWNYAFESFYNSPIIGAYNKIITNSYAQMHNTHVDILSSYGILVFILFIIFIIYIIKKLDSDKKDSNSKIYLLGFIAIILYGMGETALIGGTLGLYIYIGNLILLAKKDEGD